MESSNTRGSLLQILRPATLLIGVAATVIVVGLVLVLVGSRLVFSARALPGVRAAGIELGGMSKPEVELALGQVLTYPQTGTVLLQDQTQHWIARPADLGVAIDIPSMAEQALTVGRQGSVWTQLRDQVESWSRGHGIPTYVLFDQRAGAAYMDQLAHSIDRPQLEATLAVNGLQIDMRSGQIGRELEVEANLDILAPAFSRMHDAEINLVVEESPPLVLDAAQQAAIAQEILRQPLTLTAEGGGPWVISPDSLADMMRFILREEHAQYEVGLDPSALAELLAPLAPELKRSPDNARFIFNDETRELDLMQEAVIGRALNVPATIEAINKQLAEGRHEIGLVFDLEHPTVSSDATSADLGITEAVSVVSTFFAGSSRARIQNITIAAAAFHGLLIAPGETVSMAEVLGDISLDNGYAEALIIYGDRTIKGVGGGVCQVSTTFFRTAFYGGYEIVERHPHAYRVSYYEQGRGSPGPGFDATVFVPLVDFKFTNDTPYWLLSETYIYGTQLLWKFYSSSDGRQVQVSGPQISNKVDAPKPLYKENPDLEEGEIEQVDFEVDGMDVLVSRTVSLSGELLHRDTIKTHYLPWRAIYEFGPGTELPEDAIVDED
jgi:vancomycin resistance protein YoaR